MVAAIEKTHEERYQALINNVNSEKVFSKDGEVLWQCRNCGHEYFGKEAPAICPCVRASPVIFPGEA